MNNRFIKIITPLALLAILALQGVWLYNTYSFYKEECKKKIEENFYVAFETEVFEREKQKGDKVPTDDSMEIDFDQGRLFLPKAINTILTLEMDLPIVLSDLDSLFQNSMGDSADDLSYLLMHVDSLGNVREWISRGIDTDNISERKIYYTNSVPLLANNDTESVKIYVDVPNKMIFQSMGLLLIASGIIVLIIAYCFVWQIRTIMRQNKIATIRQDFTYAMIHDMKTPITTIVMGIQALKSGKLDEKPGVKNEYFDIINQESHNLLNLTNKILGIAKLEEKKIKLDKEKIPLSKFMESITNKYKMEVHKNVNFSIELNNVEYMWADPEYLKEAVSNLLDNAIKYSEDTVNININCSEANGILKIKIKDDGFGISLKDQKRIFDKFERGSKSRHKISGFGLGLNYVYQITEAHGGTLEVNSVEGVYSEFIINIPDRND